MSRRLGEQLRSPLVAVLPDYIAPNLRIVFCGTAVGAASAARGHYYSGPGNEFWPLLFEAGLTPVPLAPEDDRRIVEYGMGLTDLNKAVSQSHDRGLAYDVDGFVRKVAQCKPAWLAFHGKTAGTAAAKALGNGRSVHLGTQPWTVAKSRVFVLPSASAANRDVSRLEGRSSRLEWFRELAEVAGPRARRNADC